jgi:8-oxo-dGTP diphosphatase
MPECTLVANYHCRNAENARQRAAVRVVPRSSLQGQRRTDCSAKIADSRSAVHSCFMGDAITVFGVRNEALPQKTRPCAYAVILNAQGLIAGVRESSGRLFLPGGGIDPPETPVEAVHRELREELGCRLHLGERIGQALQYFESDGYCQALYATFYAGELGELIAATQELELEWAAAEQFFHAHHRWAAQRRLARNESNEVHA